MQYKSLVNPSFLVLMMEVQQHIQEGWYIDENNYPTANFTYYEVHLIREDSENVKDVFDENPNVVVASESDVYIRPKAGRPPRVKV